MENKKDDSDVVASSLATVIRQSLNAPFRRECLLLLGVTNIREAEEKINLLLKSREIEKRVTKTAIDMKKTITSEGGQQSLVQELEENVKGHTVPDKIDSSVPYPDLGIKLEIAVPLIIKENNYVKCDAQSTELHSDEEAQLDWEVEQL